MPYRRSIKIRIILTAWNAYLSMRYNPVVKENVTYPCAVSLSRRIDFGPPGNVLEEMNSIFEIYTSFAISPSGFTKNLHSMEIKFERD